MIVPSIDIISGDAVQLIGGETHALNAGDPRPIAKRFGLVGEVAVIDLDAALSRGQNTATIRELCKQYRCRVGGGIRDIATAKAWLDAGAYKIIIGTAASPEFLRQLPKERLIAALDAREGEVVVEGWQTKTGRTVLDEIARLRDHVSGFLVTFVECEGRMQGTQLEQVGAIVAAAGAAKVTIAGGITTADDIAKLDTLGADAQVGMALYTGRLSLADALLAPMTSDRADGLWPTVVVDEYDRALGLCYSNQQSVAAALEDGRGIYWSRRRGLWRKGEQSGHSQTLLAIDLDCDRDALRFKVRQEGPGFCHLDETSCWGGLHGLPGLFTTVRHRKDSAPEGSYTRRLMTEAGLLNAKIVEEARELVDAATPDEVAWEAADLMYFTIVKLAQAGCTLDDVINHLEARRRKVTRRRGDAKVGPE